jgi:uncharacterized integral membrane protein
MRKRLVGWFVLLPLCVVLVIFTLANRHMVELRFDPFGPLGGQAPLISPVQVPMFVVIYGVLIVGVALGGMATWFTQGAQRRGKRHWRREAKKLAHERDVSSKKPDSTTAGERTSLFDAS